MTVGQDLDDLGRDLSDVCSSVPSDVTLMSPDCDEAAFQSNVWHRSISDVHKFARQVGIDVKVTKEPVNIDSDRQHLVFYDKQACTPTPNKQKEEKKRSSRPTPLEPPAPIFPLPIMHLIGSTRYGLFCSVVVNGLYQKKKGFSLENAIAHMQTFVITQSERAVQIIESTRNGRPLQWTRTLTVMCHLLARVRTELVGARRKYIYTTTLVFPRPRQGGTLKPSKKRRRKMLPGVFISYRILPPAGLFLIRTWGGV